MSGARCVRCRLEQDEHGIPTLGACRRYLMPGSVRAWLWWRLVRADA